MKETIKSINGRQAILQINHFQSISVHFLLFVFMTESKLKSKTN